MKIYVVNISLNEEFGDIIYTIITAFSSKHNGMTEFMNHCSECIRTGQKDELIKIFKYYNSAIYNCNTSIKNQNDEKMVEEDINRCIEYLIKYPNSVDYSITETKLSI